MTLFRRLSLLGTCLAFFGGAGGAVFVYAGGYSEDAIGTTGGQFLELPVGARGAAMGTAQGAAAEDATAIYYNPANLASIQGINATFMHAMYFQDVSYDFSALAVKTPKYGTFALSAQYLAVGAVVKVDNTGNPTGETMRPRDLAVTVANAHTLGNLEYGFGGKYISSRLNSEANAYAADAGIRWNIKPAALSLGISNLGAGLKFREETAPLPTTVRVGGSYRSVSELSDKTMAFALDGVFSKGAAAAACAGIEYKSDISNSVKMALRAGYNTRVGAGGLGGLSGFTAGAGFDINWFTIDYAFAPFGGLGDSHLISLAVRFGADRGAGRATSSPYRRTGNNINRAKASANNFEPGSEGVVDVDRALLYRYSNENSEKLETLRAGMEVEVQAQLGNWLKVISESGTTGWVFKSNLAKKKPR